MLELAFLRHLNYIYDFLIFLINNIVLNHPVSPNKNREQEVYKLYRKYEEFRYNMIRESEDSLKEKVP